MLAHCTFGGARHGGSVPVPGQMCLTGTWPCMSSQQPGMPTAHMVCPGHVTSRDALLAQPGVPVRVGHGLAASLTRPGRRGTCSAGHSHGMQHCGEHGCEPFSANRASPPAYLYLVVTS